MYIDKNSVIINGVNMSNYLLQADFEYNKLWGKDTGRNLAGKMTRNSNWYISKISANF